MISVYTGTPGSGKSLKAAYDVIELLKAKKNVIANFDIDLSYFGKKKIGRFTYLPNDRMTVRNLCRFAQKYHNKDKKGEFTEKQTWIIIDECTSPDFFNVRMFGKKEKQFRRVWVAFFQLHRKLGYNVILIAQRDRDIDPQIRSFIEKRYQCRDVSQFKLFGKIISLLFGKLFICVESWYANRQKAGSQYFILHKRKANIYNSMKMFVDLEILFNQLESN